MDTISNLLPKLFSECGIAAWILGAVCVWLASQLAAARKVSETDRSSFMKQISELNATNEKLAAAHNVMQGILLGLQSRHAGDDN